MHSLSTTLALVLGLVVNAQDWALINPAYRYNYSDDGTDTISNQIRVMHIDTLGPDSFRYELNRVVKYIGPHEPSSANCFSEIEYRLDEPQFIGGSIVEFGTSWWLFGEDTVRVLPFLGPGESWDASTGTTASVISGAFYSVLGELDSVKTIGFSNGRMIEVSKHHGILDHSNNGAPHRLIGVQGAVEIGAHYPKFGDFFNYQSGDILEYHGSFGSTDGICYTTGSSITRYEFLSRTEEGTMIEYQVQRTFKQQVFSEPVFGSGGGCQSGSYSNQSAITLSIEDDHWIEANFLANRWLDKSWPGAFAGVSWDDPYPGLFATNGHGPVWRISKNSTGRYVFHGGSPITGLVEPNFENIPERCHWDTSLAAFYGPDYLNRYVEGIGRTFAGYHDFEHGETDSLYAYRIGEEHFGTLTPIDIILEVSSIRGEERGGSIWPNPSNGHVEVRKGEPGTLYSIIDTQGRIVLSGVQQNPQRLDLQALPPGSYNLKREGFAPERFIILR